MMKYILDDYEVYLDDYGAYSRTIMEAETEKTRARIQEQTDVINQVEADLRQVSPGSGSTAHNSVDQ